ncbi:MAG: hypothetical protein ACR2RV_29730 [Verrucomicrobiales bacterium]
MFVGTYGGALDGNLPLGPKDTAFIEAFDALFDTIDALVAAHQPASSPPQPNSGAKRYFRIRTESGRDSDGDGLSDRVEIMSYGTDPFYPDSDGDLFPDGIEVEAGQSGAATDPDSHPASVSELTRWRRSVGYNYSEPGTGEIDSRSQGGAWKYQSNLGSPLGHDEIVNKWLFSTNPVDPGSSHTFPDQPGGDGYVHWEGDSISAYSLAERSFHPGTAQEIDVVGYGQSRIWLEQLPVSKLPVESTVLKTIRHKTGPFGATTVATTFDFLTLTTPAWSSLSEPADLIPPSSPPHRQSHPQDLLFITASSSDFFWRTKGSAVSRVV